MGDSHGGDRDHDAGLALLTGIFAGLRAAAVVFVVGWFPLVPLVPVLGIEILPMVTNRIRYGSWSADGSASADDPREELKQRYVRGEIDDGEFEHRMRRIVAADDGEATVDEYETGPDPWDGQDPRATADPGPDQRPTDTGNLSDPASLADSENPANPANSENPANPADRESPEIRTLAGRWINDCRPRTRSAARPDPRRRRPCPPVGRPGRRGERRRDSTSGRR